MGGRHGPSAVAETAEGRSRGNGQGWWGAAIRWGAAIGARAGDCGHPTFGTGLKNFPTRCFWLGNTVADATVDDSPTVAGRDSRDGPTVRRPPSRSGDGGRTSFGMESSRGLGAGEPTVCLGSRKTEWPDRTGRPLPEATVGSHSQPGDSATPRRPPPEMGPETLQVTFLAGEGDHCGGVAVELVVGVVRGVVPDIDLLEDIALTGNRPRSRPALRGGGTRHRRRTGA